MENTNSPSAQSTNDTYKIWGYLAIFSWISAGLFILIPLIIQFAVWYHFRHKNRLVAIHALAAFNFTLTILILGFAAGLILTVAFGAVAFFMPDDSMSLMTSMGIFGFVSIVGGTMFLIELWQSIVNFMNLSDDKEPRYIFSFRILKNR